MRSIGLDFPCFQKVLVLFYLQCSPVQHRNYVVAVAGKRLGAICADRMSI